MATESVPFVDTLAESVTSSSALGTASVVFNSSSASSFFLHHEKPFSKKRGWKSMAKDHCRFILRLGNVTIFSEFAVRIGEVLAFCLPLSACFKSAPHPHPLVEGGGRALKKKLGSLVTVVISGDSP